ncbi:MAG: DUF3316 domain-containing protein [Bacteroidaceae bacterium]|nr:DUF3316 domain-containing protein [Bacteroidaceae bacterium]
MTYRLNRFFIFVMMFCMCGVTTAQRIERTRLIGVAHTNILDTYLSPLEYTGAGLLYHSASLRAFGDSTSRWELQNSFWGNVNFSSNPTEDSSEWDGQLQLDWAWRYGFELHPQLKVSVGPMVEVGAGFTYNLKGGNNPAQGRLSLAFGASAAVRYNFRWLKKDMVLNGRMDIPMLGCAFSPRYGQSYYEISIGHYDNNVVMSHPFNTPTARMLLTWGIPLKRSYLQIGYLGEARQSEFHHLKRHAWTNGLVIGYTTTLLRCK